MKIIRYKIQSDITVEFQDEYKYTVDTTYCNFKRGSISNPYSRSVYGVGYVGIGRHPTHIDKKNTDAYGTWKNILERCYHEKTRYKHPAYADCTMCNEWHNFQVFADWYEQNFYDVKDGSRMHIDKDILVKNNKIYSPETCIFVPQRINMLFMKKSRTTDSDLPTGIRRTATGFMAEYNTNYLGNYEKLEDAIEQYEKEKRIHIKELADEYKDRLPPRIYKALIDW